MELMKLLQEDEIFAIDELEHVLDELSSLRYAPAVDYHLFDYWQEIKLTWAPDDSLELEVSIMPYVTSYSMYTLGEGRFDFSVGYGQPLPVKIVEIIEPINRQFYYYETIKDKDSDAYY